MRQSSTKEPASWLCLSDGNRAFSHLGFITMLKTAWMFVRMANNTTLPKLHIFFVHFYMIIEEIVRKNAANFMAPLCWMGTNILDYISPLSTSMPL